jgi:hypothetical protein
LCWNLWQYYWRWNKRFLLRKENQTRRQQLHTWDLITDKIDDESKYVLLVLSNSPTWRYFAATEPCFFTPLTVVVFNCLIMHSRPACTNDKYFCWLQSSDKFSFA